MVAVRGIYADGLRAVDCQAKFRTGSYEWPTALWMVDSSYASPDETRVRFTTDHESWNRLDAAAHNKRVDDTVWVTVVGQLRVRRRYPYSDGKAAGGYGPFNVYPAELVVKSVQDIVVVPTKR
jgi:hypothetical protein